MDTIVTDTQDRFTDVFGPKRGVAQPEDDPRDTYLAICQDWVMDDKASGDTRPDGYSLHPSAADRAAFIQDHLENPERSTDGFAWPSGDAYECIVGKETFAEFLGGKNGIRIPQSDEERETEARVGRELAAFWEENGQRLDAEARAEMDSYRKVLDDGSVEIRNGDEWIRIGDDGKIHTRPAER